MSFYINNQIMMTVNDDINEYDIAKKWIGDDPDKYYLFARKYEGKASDTVDVVNVIYKHIIL